MLKVTTISRSFGDHRVLDRVSFDVRPGRMTGFLGANGSGKTTTMRIILGVLAPQGGSVTWNGAPVTQPVRQRFGYMPEERGLYPKMKVAEQIVWLARLHGLTEEQANTNTSRLLEQLELTARADDKLEALSLGNQQRVQVAAALVHEPDALILDEPFSGLDPIAVETVLAVLRERAAAGVPVLFSSHQLAVVERLCDDVVILSGGTIAAAGARDELRAQYGSARFQLVVGADAGWLRDHPGVRIVDLDGPRVVFDLTDTNGGRVDQQVLAAALRRGEVRSFAPVVPSLDEIFKEVI
ncbi:ABC transporter ATP-binding protein [Actinophytocola algeriensis]|uniref:ABC-2 type transport system ATP-binding protein n=1 Tax=Actinophytocola algeriensis TaxID=1768010 RepID=A0A7W7VHY3_9PSEU|nr:ATP-binding cassette domain-containing protein [Actinophytocola algeriensis]MBB4910977.1 ABC-2 type transport system ATP-binding protein [Actinophytocola algeriensis]MBE1473970.1 ABC-2 type transport system ATP-binding protein [Actinophytocola algeriensis]